MTKLTTSDIHKLRAAISAARIIDTSLVVVADGKIMGVNDKRDAAIISQLDILPANYKIGIGRFDELSKRLDLFGGDVEADLKTNAKEEVVLMTLISGRTKLQFRCTSLILLDRKYPKENADAPAAIICLTKDEANQLLKGTKAFGAEAIVVKVDAAGAVLLECVDSNNDRFSMSLQRAVEFVDRDPETLVFTYRADLAAKLFFEGTKDAVETSAVVGEGGSLTFVVREHTLIVMPKADGE